jgi:PKD repeat protein
MYDFANAQTPTAAVNSGGSAFTASDASYSADSFFNGGNAASFSNAIANTTDDTLYQSERYGNFSYNIPVTNGSYTVTLKFAEVFWTGAGQRVFHVDMEGTRVLSNLDIYAQVGANAAYDRTFTANVTDGTLNIIFTTVTDNSKVSAIKVVSNSVPPPSPGQSAYRVQVDNDPAFGSPEWDSGVVNSNSTTNSTGNCNASNPPGTGVGTCRMVFNVLYYARVMAWDNNNNPTVWQNMSVCLPYPGQTNRCQTAPTCTGGQTNCWRTPPHSYPTSNFSYSPPFPSVGNPVSFTDLSSFCNGGACGAVSTGRTWSWTFAGASPATSTAQNPAVSYAAAGTYQINLTTGDDAGSCVATPQNVTIQKALPKWREVAPK